MPTGYTAEVADGKVTDFRTFALRCARQFGATIMQRDNPMDEPPKHREPTDYYANALAESQRRMAELDAMTPADAKRAAREAHKAALASRERYAAERKRVRARYDAMLAEVRAWEPPTADHVGLKNFMIDQLQESIKWDTTEWGDVPKLEDAADWLAAAKDRERRAIARNAEENAKELERCASANRWIDALYDSLAQQPA